MIFSRHGVMLGMSCGHMLIQFRISHSQTKSVSPTPHPPRGLSLACLFETGFLLTYSGKPVVFSPFYVGEGMENSKKNNILHNISIVYVFPQSPT